MSGSYKVNLPDGRIQTVTYKAGGKGGKIIYLFVPLFTVLKWPFMYYILVIGNVVDVSYEGTAVYPEDMPDYKAPAPYSAPKYDAPKYDAPRYEAPKYDAPKYDAPRYEAPKYDAPRYERPSY